MTDSPKTVSLVLGSGGARGLAHIGVIHWLRMHGYQIASISGCSMGALVGGIYAAGKLDEYEKWVRAVTKKDIFTLLDFTVQGGGLVKGDKIIDTLKGLVGDQRIEDLSIPFTAVATDLKSEREVWLNKGSLFTAIRASISIPLFFTPVRYKQSRLIDGGVLNPVPIAPTLGDHTDMTIAVNLGGAMEREDILHKISASTDKVSEDRHERNDSNQSGNKKKTEANNRSMNTQEIISNIAQFVDDARESATNYLNRNYFSTQERLGMYDVAFQSFEAMQGLIARQKIASYPPDVLVEIPRNVCRSFDFDRAEELIDTGYRATEQVMTTRRPRLIRHHNE